MGQRLSAVAAGAGTGGNVLYYLATPPSLFEPIAGGLARAGLAQERDGAWRRLIVEKPFGYDLQSARALNERLHSWFGERQIYRIDHYLGKETVQNVLVLRFANEVWEPLWTRATIDRVEITAAEQVGVEGRGGYYDGSGALRDMFQNHLLQVVGMIAMEPPAHFRPSAVRNETVKVFDSLRPIAPSQVAEDVVRGQYTGSLTTEGAMAGYREEPGVPAGSSTETYVALRFHIDNRRWAGVPFLVRTGKRLPARITEVVIHFKQVPHHLFGRPPAELISGAPYSGGTSGQAVSAAAAEASKLIIRIQPDEAIQLRCNVKLPGAGFDVQQVGMDFRYADLAGTYLPGSVRTAAARRHDRRRHSVRARRRDRVVLGVRAADPEGVAGASRHPPARLPGRELGTGRRCQPVSPPRLRLAHAGAVAGRRRRPDGAVGACRTGGLPHARGLEKVLHEQQPGVPQPLLGGCRPDEWQPYRVTRRNSSSCDSISPPGRGRRSRAPLRRRRLELIAVGALQPDFADLGAAAWPAAVFVVHAHGHRSRPRRRQPAGRS